MGWERPILTDSGGFQVVSLAAAGRAEVMEEGVQFSDPRGATHRLTPEDAIELQARLAPDVMMTLDQPLPFPAGFDAQREATDRTHRWAARCRSAWTSADVALFGIVQGGFDVELRKQSARFIGDLDFPGYGIGGLSLGEPKEQTRECTLACNAELGVSRPRYLMGVGSEPEMLDAIEAGIDLFDCAWPTRLARTGAVLVGAGRANIRRAAFADDFGPLEQGCDCRACRDHSRAYVRHLYLRGELLGLRLLTMHNLRHLLSLLRGARAAVLAGTFGEFRAGRINI
jgi:queuine tRNA-ribosyltransferase